MPLAWNKIEVPFGLGVDEKSHRFISSPPGLAQLNNGRIDHDGQVNVRPGYKVKAQPHAVPEKLLKYRDRLLAMYRDPSALTNNVELAMDAMNDVGTRFDVQGGVNLPTSISEATIDGRSAITRDQNGSITGVDLAIHESSRLAVMSWSLRRIQPGTANPTRIYAIVIDIDTLATVAPLQEISTGPAAGAFLSGTRIVIEGSTAHVVYINLSANDIRVRDYNLSARTWGSDTLIVNDANTTIPVFDATDTGTGIWFLAYRDTTPQLVIKSFIGTGLVSTGVVADDPKAIGMFADSAVAGGQLWVAWNKSGTSVRAALWDFSLIPILAATNLEVTAVVTAAIGIVEIVANKAIIVWTQSAATLGERPITRFRTLTPAGVLGTTISRHSVTLESRPVLFGSHIYATLGYRAHSPESIPLPQLSITAYFTVALVGWSAASAPDELTCFRSCALWAQGSADPIFALQGVTTSGRIIPNMRRFGATDTRYWFPALVVSRVANAGTDASSAPLFKVESGADLCRFNLQALDRVRFAEFGDHLFLSGGQNTVFDGTSLVEHGFLWPPEDAVASVSVGTGSLSAGSYQIALVWQYRMNSGAIMRSQPFIVPDAGGSVTLTAAAGDSIVLRLPPLNLTQKFNAGAGTKPEFVEAVAAVVYRTEANGSLFYREGVIVNDVIGSSAAPALAGVVTATDASVKASEQLYTTGGILPSWALPACDDFVVYKNRLFGISSEDKKALVFTHALSDGEVPMWHPFLSQRLDDEGACVGLAVLDDNLIVLKEDAIFAVRGNGPDRKGLNSDYVVSRVQSPHGCMDRRSIVSDPNGVYFRSRYGIMRLNRNLTVDRPGDKVQDELTDHDTIVCAVALPNYIERLYFLCDNDDNDPKILVYQWNNDQWAVDRSVGTEGALFPRSMVWVGGLAYAIFAGDPNVYEHSGESDPFNIIAFSIASQWFKFAGPQGFKRIRALEILMDRKSSFSLTLKLFRDYEETTPFQQISVPAATLDTLKPCQVKVHVSEQRCESMRFTIAVVPNNNDSNNSDKVTFVAQAFDVGIKPTMMRLPPAAQTG